ncbi:LD-carboxypeptidase [Candidatus Woesearchaeota archaeon]|nr:LD-carboxypeptidase [Candidatus Woesearchaeota archaeon]
MIKPKKLSKGDTIAIIAPSGGLGGLFPHRVDNGIKALIDLGFKVKEYPTIRNFKDGKSGTEQERIKDLHDAFKDKIVKAIVCNIGGLSANSILDKIDYNLIKKNPKIFCGYSDITLLHLAFLKKVKLVTFYGPCLMTQFGEYPKPLPYTTQYFLKALFGGNIGKIAASETWTDEFLDWGQKKDLERPRRLVSNKEGFIWLQRGKVTGKIIGGCLYSLLQLKGTEYDVDYKDKILFIETPEGQSFAKGEPLAYVDTQIMDLRNAGVFDKIKGLIIGKGFGYTEEEREKFKQIVVHHTKDYEFPVLFNVNIGHTDPMITLPLNVKISLDSEKDMFRIDEEGVSLKSRK